MISALISSLQNEISRIDGKAGGETIPPPESSSFDVAYWTKTAVGIAGALLLPLVLVLLFKDGVPPWPVIARRLGSFFTLMLLVGGGVFFLGDKFGQRGGHVHQRHSGAFRLAGDIDSLRYGGGLPIEGESVGAFPWVATELDHVVECDLYGTYRGHKLAVLRCTYVVDNTIAAVEDSAGKMASMLMSRVQHEGVRRHELEAIVFTEPVSGLPDILWGGRKQPLFWYFKKAFPSLEMKCVVSDTHWFASSDPGASATILANSLQPLFEGRKDPILEVMGGYVVVIPQHWDWHHPEMAEEPSQIKQNLDWACDLYEAMVSGKKTSPVVSVSTPTEPPFPIPSNVSEMNKPVFAGPLPSTSEKTKPTWTPSRVLKAMFGFCCLFIGCIVSLAIYMQINQPSQAQKWPVASGKITVSQIETRKSASELYYPHVEYTYAVKDKTFTGKQIAFGPEIRSAQREKIEPIIASYPLNKAVQVRFDPKKPEKSVLELRLNNPTIYLVMMFIFIATFFFGGWLFYRQFR